MRNSGGESVLISSLADITPSFGPSLVPLFNLNPSATVNGASAQGYAPDRRSS